MDSKESFQRRTCLWSAYGTCLPSPPSSRAACGHCSDGLSDNFNFFKMKCFYISERALEMTFELHRAGQRSPSHESPRRATPRAGHPPGIAAAAAPSDDHDSDDH